jgi:hypothetical protein
MELAVLPAFDFRFLELVGWAIICSPFLLIGAIAPLLSSAAGVDDGARLSHGRRTFATACGSGAGCLILVSAFFLGVSSSSLLEPKVRPLYMLLVVVGTAVLATIVAYQVARFAAVKLSWRQCAICGARFRSRDPVQYCKRCDDRLDETERVIPDPSTQYRE